MKRMCFSLCMAVMFVFALSPASLHAQEDASKWIADCKGDIQKFCKDTERGGGKVLQCLQQHRDELSEPCKAQMIKKGGSRYKVYR